MKNVKKKLTYEEEEKGPAMSGAHYDIVLSDHPQDTVTVTESSSSDSEMPTPVNPEERRLTLQEKLRGLNLSSLVSPEL